MTRIEEMAWRPAGNALRQPRVNNASGPLRVAAHRTLLPFLKGPKLRQQSEAVGEYWPVRKAQSGNPG